MTEENLLPETSGRAENALADAVASQFRFPIDARHLWNPHRCPAALLPWLAYALSVDEWNEAWPEGLKRNVIAASIEIHRRKGTVWAVRRAIDAAGFGDAVLVESFGVQNYDGGFDHDGDHDHAAADHWAEYRLILTRPVTIEQADTVRRIAGAVAPARCHLKALDFTRALNLYDGSIAHGGTFSHGVA